MTVGLFVPCYIEQYYPHVAIATLDLLEKHGCEVEIPVGQTCCGQPLSNAGFGSTTKNLVDRFGLVFGRYDYVVAPSASCVLHVVDHHSTSSKVQNVSKRTFEVCQFLHEVLGVTAVDAEFNYRVGIHSGCHGLRGLRLGPDTELMESRVDIVRTLLESVRGIDLVDLDRQDECCGFGGTFSVSEEAISVKMGRDRLRDHEQAGAQFVASTDMSCLMHLQGIASRESRPTKFVHVVEILNGYRS